MRFIFTLLSISIILIYLIFAAEEESFNFLIWDWFVQSLLIVNYIALVVFYLIAIYHYKKREVIEAEELEKEKDEIPTDMIH
jgi:Ca2+/Na+ antiporter